MSLIFPPKALFTTGSKRWDASSSVSRSYPRNEDNRFFKTSQNVCREMCFVHSDTEPGASSLIARFGSSSTIKNVMRSTVLLPAPRRTITSPNSNNEDLRLEDMHCCGFRFRKYPYLRSFSRTCFLCTGELFAFAASDHIAGTVIMNTRALG